MFQRVPEKPLITEELVMVLMMFLLVSVSALMHPHFGAPLWAGESGPHPYVIIYLPSFVSVYLEASGTGKHIMKATEGEINYLLSSVHTNNRF